jgi:hypothetical protein
MILRLSSPAGRGLLVLLAFVLAATLSYSGIRNAIAVNDAGLNTQQGTSAPPNSSRMTRNWYLLGRYWQYNLKLRMLAAPFAHTKQL